jgi:FtsP/CotA-like multicopper oxidase with cupredoxin domain
MTRHRQHAWMCTAAFVILAVLAVVPSARADIFSVTDANAAPNIFECDLTAIEKDVTLAGATVHAMVYRDDAAAAVPMSAGMPILVIKVKVGDMIVCRFKNELTVERASIHWHGLELDNDSDGTAVTQDAVLPGQSYTYQFQTFRPGIFWFHSHMLPGNTLFAGLYGVIIIENDIEASLKGTTLPTDSATFTLAMSDIEFDAAGVVGKPLAGVTKTENELIEICHLFKIGDPGGVQAACNAAGKPGATVLVNGQTPDAAAHTPLFTVPSGGRVRLRLLNESISRHFRLKLTNSGDNKLYRIGGQGGLLDNIILEGGTKDMLETGFAEGEINLGSGERADVLIYPTGSAGDILTLVGNPLDPPFNLSTGLPANYPVAFFQISGTASDTAPAAGDAILAGTAEDVEDLKGLVTTPLIDPAPFGGTSDETIKLTDEKPAGYVQQTPSVDALAAMLDTNLGNGDWLLVPHPPNARYVHIGDVLELTVQNDTSTVHPYHLHGFSMQPVRYIRADNGQLLYDFPYDEFLDTIDLLPAQALVFRVRIDDRPRFCDLSPSYPPGPVLADCETHECGGVVGRWLYHCHIVQHGSLGMISEIDVIDAPPQIICPDPITQGTDAGLCSAVVTFSPTATDDCGPLIVDSVPPSGSAFPKGTTTVTSTVTDDSGQTASCSFDVTVVDDDPPQVTSSVTVSVFWSPNHDLINVGLAATAIDNCPDPVTFGVVVYGDENDELPTGDGTYSPDAKNIAVGTLRLRAERKQNADGRVYLIVVTATDGSGNKTVSVQTVVCPKNLTTKQVTSVLNQAATAKAFFLANNAPPPGYFVIGDGPIVGPKQ